ncbi:MAG: hypothetical protein HYV95_06505 [Opitutae bacterium]|nr:hypothetical protein [Opitutae bacterium]
MARLTSVPFLAAALLLAGCPSLPDTQPFTDATVGLRSAVAASGTAVVAELKRNPVDGMAAQGASLEKAWQVRTKAMSALVDYANSLQAIADSGRKGEESAQKLADAATTLVQTLGAANLAASAGASLAIDTFKFANGQIARARAAKSLEAALAEMQPAIERIAELFAADLTDLDTLVQTTIDAQRDRLERDNQSEINYRRRLLAARRSLMAKAASQLDEQVKPTALAGSDDLKRADELLAANEAWHTAYAAQQAAIAERGRLAAEMLGAAQAAFADWTAAHARLLAAVRAKRLPSMAELTAAAKRIQELVDRYRKL